MLDLCLEPYNRQYFAFWPNFKIEKTDIDSPEINSQNFSTIIRRSLPGY